MRSANVAGCQMVPTALLCSHTAQVMVLLNLIEYCSLVFRSVMLKRPNSLAKKQMTKIYLMYYSVDFMEHV
jgi:hypothetical protein